MNRAEISKKNPHYISKHRYYELKHFCLQYPEWKHALDILDGWGKSPDDLTIVDAKGKTPTNPTEKIATARAFYSKRIELIDKVIDKLNPSLAPYVKMGVTEELTYDVLQIRACRKYRGIIRMDNRNGSWCVAEACVRRLKNKYARTIFSRVDIDYMSDFDGCYIIITTKW